MKVLINGQEEIVNVIEKNSEFIRLELGSREFKVFRKDVSSNIEAFQDGFQVFDGEVEAYAKILPKAKKAGSGDLAGGSLLSPMPGKIFKIIRAEGESVSKGETILIMEAMKMEHAIKATDDGVVKKIFYKEGEQVDGQSLLCEVE